MDQQQFRELALRELPAVYRMARRLCYHQADVDDLVQQTYLNALRGAGGFQLKASGMRPWLFKILHNAYRSRLQQRAREPMLIADTEQQPELAVTDGDGQAGYIELPELDWEQVDERLKQAIHALPQPMRSVFLLTAVEGMRYRQVAAIVGIPIGTVMSTLYRARARLLKMLAPAAAAPRGSGGKSADAGEQKTGVASYQDG